MNEFNWSPGIGDPTIMGWLTVFLYFFTALECFILSRKQAENPAISIGEIRIWQSLALVFLLLGFNKQLDLHSAITELGRVLAHAQGWYEDRGKAQFFFFGAVAACCLLALAVLVRWCRGAAAELWLALGGSVLLFSFILVRAASFHHIDQFIGERVLGLAWNWVLEIGGIMLVLLATRFRRRSVNAVWAHST